MLLWKGLYPMFFCWIELFGEKITYGTESVNQEALLSVHFLQINITRMVHRSFRFILGGIIFLQFSPYFVEASCLK